MSVIFLADGVDLIVRAFHTAAATFTCDAIELRSIHSRLGLPLNKIRGRREFMARDEEGAGTHCLSLVPEDDRPTTLQFMKGHTFDDMFDRWFNELPDLDAEDKKVHKDTNFGIV